MPGDIDFSRWAGSRRRYSRRRAGAAPSSDGVTFVHAAREWLRYVEEDRAVKPSTLRNYRSSVEAHLVPAFGRRRIDEIMPTDVERWRARLTASPRTKKAVDILCRVRDQQHPLGRLCERRQFGLCPPCGSPCSRAYRSAMESSDTISLRSFCPRHQAPALSTMDDA